MLVLNFHHVEDKISHADRKVITITPSGLRQCIRTLRAIGFEIVSLRDVLRSPELIGHRKKVVFTFDDGFVNNLEFGLPILEAEKCPATIFLLPGRFSGTNAWDHGHLPEPERDQLMSLEQIKTMGRSPYITYGSHGMLHQDMRTLDAETLQWELNESHEILQRELPKSYLPVLAYPWGYYNEAVVKAMETTPYQYAFTVEKDMWATDSKRFEVPRHSAYYRDGNPLMLVVKMLRNGLLV